MAVIPLNRRSLLQLMGAGAGTAALLPFSRVAHADVSEIVWATYETTGKEEFFKAYTEQTGINVDFSYLANDDALFAGLQAGSASNWDVLNPGLNGTARYIESGLFHTLDLGLIPNADSMYEAFKSSSAILGDDGSTKALPYLWGLNPVVYRTDKFDSPPDYDTLFDPKYAGQLAMRDYALESIAIGALHLGIPRDQVFSLDDAQLAEVKKVLIEQKPLLRTYWQSISDLSNLFATGEVTCAFCWRVPYDQLKDTMPVAMATPKAGIFGWCDCLAIPASLPDDRLEAAHGFINYLLGPEFAMDMATKESYATSTPVIRDELTVGQQTNIFINDLSIMDSFMWPVTPPNYDAWLKVWNEVKAS
jgi:spermidine/putrescine transport system substrate-binding protein